MVFEFNSSFYEPILFANNIMMCSKMQIMSKIYC